MPRNRDRRSRRGEESRRRILEATFELATELGYEETTIARVSERAGLPTSSLYWHFASKDDLFAEMIEHSFVVWKGSVPDWRPPDDPVEARTRAPELVTASIRSILATPDFWRLGLILALERHAIEPAARRRFLEIRRTVQAHLAAYWRTALSPDQLVDNPDLPELLARFAMATADGILVAARAEEAGIEPLTELLSQSLQAAVERRP